MSTLAVTSTRKGEGKTALLSALALHFKSRGRRTAYLKVAQDEDDADAQFLSTLADSASVAPPGRARETLQRLSRQAEVVLVELPALEEGADAVKGLDVGPVVVVNFRPGLEASQVAGAVEPLNGSAQGLVLNGVTPYRRRDVQAVLVPALQQAGLQVLGTLPEDRLMLAPTVGQLAEHLGGRWVVCQERRDLLVERFLVGGNPMDWGVEYFGRYANKAVIVRGRRPDIQMAALSTDTTCLVLTNGEEPTQYVYHEANFKDVPTFVVDMPTLKVLEALGGVLEKVTVHHPQKAHRFLELLGESGLLESLEGLALGT